MAETPKKPKSELGAYIATYLLVGALIAAMAGAVRHWVLYPAPLKAPDPAFGFGPGWDCIGAGAKGGGFCIRRPPAQPAAPPAKAETRP